MSTLLFVTISFRFHFKNFIKKETTIYYSSFFLGQSFLVFNLNINQRFFFLFFKFESSEKFCLDTFISDLKPSSNKYGSLIIGIMSNTVSIKLNKTENIRCVFFIIFLLSELRFCKKIYVKPSLTSRYNKGFIQ